MLVFVSSPFVERCPPKKTWSPLGVATKSGVFSMPAQPLVTTFGAAAFPFGEIASWTSEALSPAATVQTA
jgi:hypothetical protein